MSSMPGVRRRGGPWRRVMLVEGGVKERWRMAGSAGHQPSLKLSHYETFLVQFLFLDHESTGGRGSGERRAEIGETLKEWVVQGRNCFIYQASWTETGKQTWGWDELRYFTLINCLVCAIFCFLEGGRLRAFYIYIFFRPWPACLNKCRKKM